MRVVSPRFKKHYERFLTTERKENIEASNEGIQDEEQSSSCDKNNDITENSINPDDASNDTVTGVEPSEVNFTHTCTDTLSHTEGIDNQVNQTENDMMDICTIVTDMEDFDLTSQIDDINMQHLKDREIDRDTISAALALLDLKYVSTNKNKTAREIEDASTNETYINNELPITYEILDTTKTSDILKISDIKEICNINEATNFIGTSNFNEITKETRNIIQTSNITEIIDNVSNEMSGTKETHNIIETSNINETRDITEVIDTMLNEMSGTKETRNITKTSSTKETHNTNEIYDDKSSNISEISGTKEIYNINEITDMNIIKIYDSDESSNINEISTTIKTPNTAEITDTEVIPKKIRRKPKLEQEVIKSEDLCICAQDSGEMITCANPECAVSRYHLQCVFLDKKPAGPWTCDTCKSNIKKEKNKEKRKRLLRNRRKSKTEKSSENRVSQPTTNLKITQSDLCMGEQLFQPKQQNRSLEVQHSSATTSSTFNLLDENSSSQENKRKVLERLLVSINLTSDLRSKLDKQNRFHFDEPKLNKDPSEITSTTVDSTVQKSPRKSPVLNTSVKHGQLKRQNSSSDEKSVIKAQSESKQCSTDPNLVYNPMAKLSNIGDSMVQNKSISYISKTNLKRKYPVSCTITSAQQDQLKRQNSSSDEKSVIKAQSKSEQCSTDPKLQNFLFNPFVILSNIGDSMVQNRSKSYNSKTNLTRKYPVSCTITSAQQDQLERQNISLNEQSVTKMGSESVKCSIDLKLINPSLNNSIVQNKFKINLNKTNLKENSCTNTSAQQDQLEQHNSSVDEQTVVKVESETEQCSTNVSLSPTVNLPTTTEQHQPQEQDTARTFPSPQEQDNDSNDGQNEIKVETDYEQCSTETSYNYNQDSSVISSNILDSTIQNNSTSRRNKRKKVSYTTSMEQNEPGLQSNLSNEHTEIILKSESENYSEEIPKTYFDKNTTVKVESHHYFKPVSRRARVALKPGHSTSLLSELEQLRFRRILRPRATLKSYKIENEEIPVEDNDPYAKWCFCRSVESGQMIACDYDECTIRWFHCSCVNIKKIPRGKWYCDKCKKIMERKRRKWLKKKKLTDRYSSCDPN